MYQSKYRGDEIEQKLDQLDVAQPLSKVISDFDKDLSDQSRKLTELEAESVAQYNNLVNLIFNNKTIVVSGNVGEIATIRETALDGWGSFNATITENIQLTIIGRGGSSSPLYAILGENDVILEKSTITSPARASIITPKGAKKIIVNNDYNSVHAPLIKSGVIGDLQYKTNNLERIAYIEKDNLLMYAEIIKDKYVSKDCVLVSSSSWDSYIVDLNRCVISSIKVNVGNLGDFNPAVSFYNSKETFDASTFVGGVPFLNLGENVLDNIEAVMPKDALVAIVCNRKATSADVEIYGSLTIDFLIGDLSEEEDVNLCKRMSKVYSSAYIKPDGSLQESTSWRSWLLPRGTFVLKGYTNDLTFRNVAFYNGVPSSDTFISGMGFSSIGKLSSIELNESNIPSNTSYILFASRIATGADSEVLVKSGSTLGDKLHSIFADLNGRSEVKKVYRGYV